MYESPFQTHADLLINGRDASAQYLQSFVLSMHDSNNYKFSAQELSSLSDAHFDIFIELAKNFRDEGRDSDSFKKVCREMINRRPDYTQEPCGFYMFPEPEHVFVPDQTDLARHLHPLFSIDLSMVNREWSGELHMLCPLEPGEDRQVGFATEHTDYHSALLQTNWIGFKLEGRHYRLMGDPRYFFLHEENAGLSDPYPDTRSELTTCYEDCNSSFEAVREAYRKTGYLLDSYRLHYGESVDSRDRCPFVEQIGGDVDLWTVGMNGMPLYITESEYNGIRVVYPRSPSGHPFHHVATVPTYSYQLGGPEKIIMFYEPIEKLVLFTFYSKPPCEPQY
ncbi:hypothetical protein [Pseudomonas putida]|uniref:hypothetical protein n=1 Tax=Pseudomonas putida TaxID=303 RepID=UPI003D33B7FB